MSTKEIKELCKTLRLAYITDHYEEIPFENKEQFLHDVLHHEIKSRHTKGNYND